VQPPGSPPYAMQKVETQRDGDAALRDVPRPPFGGKPARWRRDAAVRTTAIWPPRARHEQRYCDEGPHGVGSVSSAPANTRKIA